MKDNRVFVDTNIFIYAIMEDERSKDKHRRAVSLFNQLSDQVVFINTQVINEIYSVMLKHDIDDKAIQDKIAAIIKETNISFVNLETIKKCWDIRIRYKYSYWDSLILASAIENHCDVLYSEDMQKNQIIDNSIKIINPFIN